MNQSALIRPDWTPATIALMVLGFVVFWPLGLAMLAYIIFGDRLKTFKKDANDTMDGMFASCRGKFRGGRGSAFRSATGNVAFDEYREETLRRLEDEQREFHDFLGRLRMARDKAEFDQFMNDRRNNPPANTPAQPDAA